MVWGKFIQGFQELAYTKYIARALCRTTMPKLDDHGQLSFSKPFRCVSNWLEKNVAVG